MNVYVLKLENNKFYVGKTTKKVEIRFQEHLNEKNCFWTSLHKPLEIIEVINNADELEEDRTTKKMMQKFGIESTRGGSYVQITLDENQLILLKKEICTSYDLCFKCSKKDHKIKNCKEKTDAYGNKLKFYCEKCFRDSHEISSCYATKDVNGKKISQNPKKKKEVSSENNKKKKEVSDKPIIHCERCFRNSHHTSNCYATFDKYDNPLTQNIIECCIS